MDNKPITFEGELKKLDPRKLCGLQEKNDVANFFLVLGLVYNDLKSLTIQLIQTNKAFAGVGIDDISPEKGEYAGVKAHIMRLSAATVHEFLIFLRENQKAIGTFEFQMIYKCLDRELKDMWDVLVSVSLKDSNVNKATHEFSDVLMLIRNNLTFHYYQSGKMMRKGFLDTFYNDPRRPENGSAYYTLGDDMHNTRFFYCDAAAQRAAWGPYGSNSEAERYAEQLREMIEKINFTIMALMREYIRLRS